MSSSTILVLGCNGLLGQRVSEFLARGTSHRLVLAGRTNAPLSEIPDASYVRLDITRKTDVRNVVENHSPRFILNAAAMTNVDECESQRELAWKTNVGGVENLIEAAKRIDATIVHVSTDYVFDGTSGPYTEEDKPNPVNYYGRTKLASENQLRASTIRYVIARTMVLYGYGRDVKSNFALWLIQNLEEKKPVQVVDDQTGNPTLADDLAHAIVNAIELEKTGIFHVAGRDIVSRYTFAQTLARVFDFDQELISPIKTSALQQPAARPMKSGLVTIKAEVDLGFEPSTVEEGLTRLRGQLSRNPRRLPDSSPVPGRKR